MYVYISIYTYIIVHIYHYSSIHQLVHIKHNTHSCILLSSTVLHHGRFPKFHRVFLGRDPGTLKSDIVSKKTSTINLFGFETLKLKIRRLKLNLK